MRHTVICSVAALTAALASLVIAPAIAYLFFDTALPGALEDAGVWIFIFAGPMILGVFVIISGVAGAFAFHMAKARLPDEWLSLPMLVILLALAATIATIVVVWPYNIVVIASPYVIG
jgi:hypothetical protein